MSEKIKILIVDDTATYRKIMTRVIEEIPNAEPIGTAPSGGIALDKLDFLEPDLILLDVMMPEMDGVETLQRIKEKRPNIEIVMISAFDMANAIATIESLEHGALDFIAKPVVKDMHEGIVQLKEKLEPLIQLLITNKEAPKTVTAPKQKIEPEKPVHQINLPKKIDYVVLGISTGGPNALYQMMPSLDRNISCPILIVQHMPPLFTKSLAERLGKVSPLPIKETESGDSPLPGHIYIAPGGSHMVLEIDQGKHVLTINDDPPVNNCRPSVDVLFESVAKITNGDVLSVIMTGMGRDGTEGVATLKQKGAISLIQDQSTSVVWGMPRSVFEAGTADEVIPLEKMGQRISEIVLGK